MVKQKTQVVRMTPDMARDILKNNPNNRNVKRDRVSLYATEMEKGRWQLNGESIVIDENGNLKDGQHRLMAVVKSQCTVPMIVVTGVDADCSIYDRGSSRSVRDIMQINMVGEKWKQCSHIIAVCNRFLYLKKATNRCNSDFDVIKFIETYEKELEQLYHIAIVRSKYSRSSTVASAIFLAIHNGDSIEKLNRYVQVLNTGMMDSPTDSPAILIRNMCVEKKLTDKSKESMATVVKSIEDFGTYARKKLYRNCDTMKVDNFIEEMKRKGF